MKERGVIFNAEMVRAILNGSKTQTRRVADVGRERGFNVPVVFGKEGRVSSVYFTPGVACCCPFGDVGDRLWVRETYRVMGCATDVARLMYKASERNSFTESTRTVPVATCTKQPSQNWTPSIHMSRWASRILLEITNVRVERLNAISDKDAQAEGVQANELSPTRYVFGELWQSIYGADNPQSWQANPWVWVIEFKRVEANNEQ
jgi:hypothetical protein